MIAGDGRFLNISPSPPGSANWPAHIGLKGKCDSGQDGRAMYSGSGQDGRAMLPRGLELARDVPEIEGVAAVGEAQSLRSRQRRKSLRFQADTSMLYAAGSLTGI